MLNEMETLRPSPQSNSEDKVNNVDTLNTAKTKITVNVYIKY